MVGTCEHGHETSGSKKGREFDYPSDYWLLKRDSVPWCYLENYTDLTLSNIM
jgi:hypothetical protein